MDEKLIIQLYKEKSDIIYKYLLKRGCSHEDAEDIVQNVFSKAIEYMIYLEKENLSAWLFKVAVNQYYDICRKSKRHPIIEFDEASSNALLDECGDGIKHLIIKEEKQMIKKVFELLSETYKNLLLLKYDMGLSYKQISDITEMSEDKIRTYLYRARNEFKKQWEALNNERK